MILLGVAVRLSGEQKVFIDAALAGNNVLVDACIGSGKTTSIQRLCDKFDENKRILYLTYSKLLKLDAQAVIKSKNTLATNYHAFAYKVLDANGVTLPAVDELPSAVVANRCEIERYDVLIVDEYQDIAEDTADLLQYIKDSCPGIQIIMVGDMCQKIYDTTDLNVAQFAHAFIGSSALQCSFTKCFRLSEGLAKYLGDIWGKKIVGVNPDCVVEQMSMDDAISFLKECEPENILCLGMSTGDRVTVQNRLEKECPRKFNKRTLWSKVGDSQSGGGTSPSEHSAIFTTYDGSMGMERDVCVICDFSITYWALRIEKPNTKWEILRNIFCVAASRGKRRIIFVEPQKRDWLVEDVIAYDPGMTVDFNKPLFMSELFDYKPRASVKNIVRFVSQTSVQEKSSKIVVKRSDGHIDLSMCVGNYQEAVYFSGYNICLEIESIFQFRTYTVLPRYDGYESWPLHRQVLYLTALQTKQVRYFKQVKHNFITDKAKEQIKRRFASRISEDARVQVECGLAFSNADNTRHIFTACGRADAVVGDTVYEFKFVSALTDQHILQCAMYVVALDLRRGLLWNIMTDEMIEILVEPDSLPLFFNAVTACVTRGRDTSCTVFRYTGKTKMPWELIEPHQCVNNLSEQSNNFGCVNLFDYCDSDVSSLVAS